MSVLDVSPHTDVRREPGFSCTLNDTGASPLKGWVVVDTLVDSMAMGGTRMTSSVTEDEVRALAQAMTVKLALVGLPIGGAEAGIVASEQHREQTLRAFGRTVSPLLQGGIHLGCDLGVTMADRAVYAEANYDVRRRPRSAQMPFDWDAYWDPLEDITGFGVGVATMTALKTSCWPETCRVVVQGFGTVGQSVAMFLEDRGHRIVGVADELGTMSGEHLSVMDLSAITDSAGRVDRRRLPADVTVSAEPDSWLDIDTDILVLAANMDAINALNVHRLSAGLVVEGGNRCCSQAKQMLAAKGIILIPDVVANVGAAAAGGLALTGILPFELPRSHIPYWVFHWVETRIRRNTRDLLEIAATTDDPLPALIAARKDQR